MYEFDENADFIQQDSQYVMHTYGRLPVEFVSGKGAVLVDSEGREYLDFLGGIGSVSLGHENPKLVAALTEQVQKVWQVGNYFYVENRAELAEDLSKLLSTTTDAEGHVTGSTHTAWKTFFSNSGAEANEGAIKLARRWGEKHLDGATGIVTAKQGFHGRTLATLAATGQKVFHKTFLPMPQGFTAAEFNNLDALEEAIANPGDVCGPVCGVMLECVQGESGVWPATAEYLQGVAKICKEHKLMFLVDEVQAGIFRCGSPFAYQLAGVEPDIVSMAKGIGGGFPMGAFSARAEVADLLGPGDHGSTFGGNALAAAAGRTAIEELVSQGIGEHVIEVGNHLAEQLATLPHAIEVRGHGLMRAVQFDVPVATEAVSESLKEGLVLNHIGDSILRFLPPLVVSSEQVDTMIGRLSGIIDRLA